MSAVHDATALAVAYARSLRPSEAEAIFFATDPDEVERVISDWWESRLDVPLTIVDAPFRDIGPPLLDEIRDRTGRGDATVNGRATGVRPGSVVGARAAQPDGFYIKRLLLLEPNVVVANVPIHLGTRHPAA